MSTDEKLNHILVKVSNMEASHETLVKDVHNISVSVNSIHRRVDTLDSCIDVHARMLKLLAYKSIDNEARNRRNNLIFRGIGEDRGETDVCCLGVSTGLLFLRN